MKNLVILLLFAAFASGCADDDDANDSKMVPNQILLTAENVMVRITLQYDEQRRVISHHIQTADIEHIDYQYSYDAEGKLASYHYATGNSEGDVIVTYDNQNRISGFVSGNTTNPVVYAGNSVTYNGETYILTDKGDIGSKSNVQFDYLTKNGVMAHVDQFNALLFTILDPYSAYYASNRAIKGYTVMNTPVVFEHTFGKGGMPASSVIDFGNEVTMTYQYIAF